MAIPLKNASLTFTAPTAGTYVVSVFPEAGSGEYVLHKTMDARVDGDFDDDGDYDTTDIDMLTSAVYQDGSVALFDLSGDGQLSLDDVDAWLAEAGEVNLGPELAYQPGDANLDGVVDGPDFILWNSHKFTADHQWSHGDFNADGSVDGLDFLIWNQHKFTAADVAAQREPNGPAAVAEDLSRIRDRVLRDAVFELVGSEEDEQQQPEDQLLWYSGP